MATLDDLISAVKNLGEGMSTKVAEACVPVIENLIQQGIASGTDPYGTVWPANKDGTKPLDGIDKYIAVTAEGSTIMMTLNDPAGYHQTGTSRLPQRKIVPDLDLPPTWEEAIQQAVDEVVANGTINIR